MTEHALKDLGWFDFRAAAWWLGLLYRRPKHFREALRALPKTRMHRAGVILMTHALIYGIIIAGAGRLLLFVGFGPLFQGDRSTIQAEDLAFWVAAGIAFGIPFGIIRGIASGTAAGVAIGIAFVIAFAIAFGITGGNGILRIVGAIGVAIVFGIAGGIASGINRGIAGGNAIAFSIALGIAFAIVGIILEFDRIR